MASGSFCGSPTVLTCSINSSRSFSSLRFAVTSRLPMLTRVSSPKRIPTTFPTIGTTRPVRDALWTAPQEKGNVDLASDHLSKEQGYPRIFSLNGRHYFLAACYHTFGITQKNLANPGVDVVLDFVHGFHLPRKRTISTGEKNMSGDVDFARKGFAGASKQWACPVFGSAIFFNRSIAERWPSGIYWNQGGKSPKRWRYDSNPVKKPMSHSHGIPEGKVLIRIYSLTESLGA